MKGWKEAKIPPEEGDTCDEVKQRLKGRTNVRD